ncbi:hypothetical protein [Saccharopolyspora sp. ASAGF58]|uniref:hypothetical protein n=1 Tax=Saccharopolyspora sp. ASAGF58 TaxID=2719023 RepID=UPI001446CC51|nr:hypothetical protein [Saccharopolyspora sp. ASAGF58]
MNVSWKVFCPVAAITFGRSGGLPYSGVTYGAAPYQLPDNVGGAMVSGFAGAALLGIVHDVVAIPTKTATAVASAGNLGTCPPHRTALWPRGVRPNDENTPAHLDLVEFRQFVPGIRASR